MKTWKTKVIVLLLTCSLLFVGCADRESSPMTVTDERKASRDVNEQYFEWDGNLITGLSAEGRVLKSIVVPARCEGFADAVFANGDVENVSFEDADDLDLGVAFIASKVKYVILPENLTVIPSMAFQMCESLESVKLPVCLTLLEDYAFSGCERLTSIEFSGNRLQQISGNCFENCSSLAEIVIPNGVEQIEKYAFFGCKSLSKVMLPDSLKSVGSNAFGNTALEELDLPAGITDLTLDGTAFGTGAYTMKILIPAGSWLDENRASWDIGFGEIMVEEEEK